VQQRAAGPTESHDEQRSAYGNFGSTAIERLVLGKIQIREDPGEDLPPQQAQPGKIITMTGLHCRGQTPQTFDMNVRRSRQRPPHSLFGDMPQAIDIDQWPHVALRSASLVQSRCRSAVRSVATPSI
jgi:hypothetical protein